MYEYIKGELVSLTPTTAVIETGGVGWLIAVSLSTSEALTVGQTTRLYIHMYSVQDQTPQLFGFGTQVERELFGLLISISGIGGNTARVMLSSHSPTELATIISTGNVAALKRVKGIGAKTAEVVIVKLRDKVIGLVGAEGSGLNADAVLGAGLLMGRSQEALDALLVLGFTKAAVQKVIKKVVEAEPDLTVEEIIRKTLSQI